jgi:hypothetical protein
VSRLAIAKDFLADYSQLEKSVQKAVTAAIGKFRGQTHAGTHLEKIRDSLDERIRTIRIDGSWRGVVLAPELGDTYCLVTVSYRTTRRSRLRGQLCRPAQVTGGAGTGNTVTALHRASYLAGRYDAELPSGATAYRFC